MKWQKRDDWEATVVMNQTILRRPVDDRWKIRMRVKDLRIEAICSKGRLEQEVCRFARISHQLRKGIA